MRARWSGKDIFKFLTEKLRVEQESWILGRGVEKSNQPQRFQDRGRTPWRTDVKKVQEVKKEDGVKVVQAQQGSLRPQSKKPFQRSKSSGGKGQSGGGDWKRPQASQGTNGGFKPLPRDQCWTCARAGRPAQHPWKECHWSKEAYKQRFGMDPPKPKEGGGKGGKGAAKPSAPRQ